MKFLKIVRWYWTPSFGTNDISFGIHICWKGRLDFHIWKGMLSIGNIPLYQNKDGYVYAVSNSFHEKNNFPVRAGVPHFRKK